MEDSSNSSNVFVKTKGQFPRCDNIQYDFYKQRVDGRRLLDLGDIKCEVLNLIDTNHPNEYGPCMCR